MTIQKTIKDAIIQSTGDNGILSMYEATDGKLYFFVNGAPAMPIKKPNKN